MAGAVKVVHTWAHVSEAVSTALSQPTEDPFVRPILVAPSTAHSRALLQSHACRYGIAAGIPSTTPFELRTGLEEDVLGIDRADDPWRPGPLALRIARIIDSPGFEIVSTHLDSCRRQGIPRASWTTARQAAEALTAIARDSHDVLRIWARGHDTQADNEYDVDLTGSPLDPARSWWAPLWRTLLAEPCPVTDPVTRHEALVDALRGRQASCGAPIVWFSSAAVPQHDVELAEALAVSRTITIIHLDHALQPHDPWRTFDRLRAATTARWVSSSLPVLGDTTEAPANELAPVDIHNCHGPDRQAEVVRDVVCEVLADDETVEPRDIVVVCSGRQDAAHLLSASTMAQTNHPANRIRFTTPPPQNRVNPVTEAVTTVLGLATARATGQDLLNLCAMPVIRARFGFSDDDQETIERLISQADIRWGVDPAAREKAGLARIRQSTWLAGIERMVLAIAMSSAPPTHLGTVTPITDVGSTTIPVVGKLAELVSRLRKAFLDTEVPAPLTVWSTRISDIVDNLTAAPSDAPRSVLDTLSLLANLDSASEDRDFNRQEIIDLLTWLSGTYHIRHSWFDGSLHVCRPGDLSPVDHKVVIIVDPDQDVVRADQLHGLRDDCLDPSTRARQDLFDVALSAKNRLIVVRQDRNAVTNLPVLPGPFTTTLTEALKAKNATAHCVVNHGLQPFSPDEFSDSTGASWRSFDQTAAEAARCQPGSRSRRDRIVLPPVTELPESRMSPTDLTLALSHPARTLLRARAGAPANERNTDLPTDLPLAPGPLDKYWIRSRILADLEHGSDPQDAIDAERLRGSTPPGRYGQNLVDALAQQASNISKTANNLRGDHDERFVEINLDLTDGDTPPLTWPDGLIVDPMHTVTLRGRVGVRNKQIVHAVASRANARPLLDLWVDVLAVTIATNETGWCGALVSNDVTWKMMAPDPVRARDILAGLARIAWWSNQQLIPLPVKLAHALVGLSPMPRRNWQTTPLQQKWSKEYDPNWAAFLSPDVNELITRCHELGTTLKNLSGWLFNPIIEASQGTRGCQPSMARIARPGA